MIDTQNYSDKKQTHRGPLPVRILLIVAAVVTALFSLVIIANIMTASMYNTATQQLNTAITQYSQSDPDLDMLSAQQTQTDSQFDDISSWQWIELPSLKESAEHNRSVSQALTAQIKKDLQDENSSSDSSSQSSLQSSSGSNSSSSQSSNSESSTDSSTTDEDTQERMKTLTDNNSSNQQNYEPQAPKTTTKKPW